jgi:HK97 family phage major capsid protein
MNTTQNQRRDFVAFLHRLQSGAQYEKRNAPDFEKTMEAVAKGVDAFKTKQLEELQALRKTVDKLETRLARPGANLGSSDGAGIVDPVLQLKNPQGREIPVYGAKQMLGANAARGGEDDFSIGDFVRDSIVGSRKAASGPALVPNGLLVDVIDRVRRQTAVVQAGASTILIDGPEIIARLTSDPTVYQHTEAANDISESDVLAEPVPLNPRLLAAIVPLTAELVADSSNLDAVLQTSLAGAFAARLDELCIAMLLADADIPESLVAHSPATWGGTLAAIGAALALNQGLPVAHISAPADYIARAGQLTTDGAWLGRPSALSALIELQTTGLTAGTALFGDWARAFAIAVRSELRLEVVRHAKPGSASHLLIAHARMEGVVLQPGLLFKQLLTPA